MNASEAISELNALSPNRYDDAQKRLWLHDLDGRIEKELGMDAVDFAFPLRGRCPSAHTGADEVEVTASERNEHGAGGAGDTSSVIRLAGDRRMPPSPQRGRQDAPRKPDEKGKTDADNGAEAELLVPAPWARDVYVNYLRARVAQADAEAERYNLYAAGYNSAYAEFAAWFIRTRQHPGREEKGWMF